MTTDLPRSGGRDDRSRAPLVRIVGRDNGAGLARDIHLLREVLERAGCAVEVVAFRGDKGINLLRQGYAGLQRRWRGPADVQVFVERVYPRMLETATRNLLVPNPEWFRDDWMPYLPRFDRVLCKTAHAQPIFERLGCAASYVGFTSDDRLDPAIPRERAFLHVAGRSSAKGTAVLLEAWRRHPEWPRLTVVQSARKAGGDHPEPRAPNIEHRVGRLGNAELRELQNRHRFHACPSEMEGFGHSLMEALSVGAVTLATDGAPMNELVRPAHGCLVAPVRDATKDLAPRHFVDVAGIEAGVARMLALDDREVRAMGAAARRRFEQADAAFRRRLPEAVLAGARSAGADRR